MEFSEKRRNAFALKQCCKEIPLIFVQFLYFMMMKSMIEKETLQPLDKHGVVSSK